MIGTDAIIPVAPQAIRYNQQFGLRSVEFIRLESLPGKLKGRSFDLILGVDVLDARTYIGVLECAYNLLRPGGHVVFYANRVHANAGAV